MLVYSRKILPSPSLVYDTYWKFAAERQAVFYRRIKSEQPNWTNDPILRAFKFTNAYRASDRVSQYLIREVIYKGDDSPIEVLFRILLFKIFNKIETWEYLKGKVGELRWDGFDFSEFAKLLRSAKYVNGAIYSGAYIMASGKSAFGYPNKHENHLKLIEQMLDTDLTEFIVNATSMESVFSRIRSYPSLGDFLSFQIAIDVNYSPLTNFSEMGFVKAGPGALDGIRKCFKSLGEYTETDVIRMMADKQDEEFSRLGLAFDGLWGRPLQLIDCQNLFCEVDKYSRVAHPDIQGVSKRTRIKQKFRPNTVDKIEYFFPPKWGINHLIP